MDPMVVTDSAVACKGLADMPAEVVALIMDRLERPRDHVACAIASPVLVARRPLVESILGLVERRIEDVLAAGAPLAVIERAFGDRGVSAVPKLLPHAVRGGNVDVAVWLHDHAADDPCQQRDMRACAGDILRNAVKTDKADVVDWALCHAATYGLPQRCIDERHADAARLGKIVSLSSFHLYRVSRQMAKGGPCGCPKDVGWTARCNDRPDVLEWMRSVGCSALCVPRLKDSIRTGRIRIALWRLRSEAQKEHPCRVPEKNIVRAAKRGHASIVALAHDLALCACPRHALIVAAHLGHLDVLRWAVGERVSGVSDPASGAVRPIAAWHGASVGYAAAGGLYPIRVIEWMLGNPDARHDLNVGVSRRALGRGCWPAVMALHDAGIAPLDRWDALDTAVASGKPSMVKKVCDHVVECGAQTFAVAIRRSNASVMRHLCERYGTDRIQGALDVCAGSGPVQRSVIVWIRDHVHGACVADVCASQEFIKTDWAGMPIEADPTAICRCSRCCVHAT